MKILFIASRFPYPAVKGDQARVLNFLKHLSKNNEIYFVCTSEVNPPPAGLELVRTLTKQLHVIPLKKKEQYLNLILGAASLVPFEVLFFKSKQVKLVIDEVLKKEKIDVIFCQMIRTAPYVDSIKLPKVIDYQDAYSLNMMRRFKSESGLVKWVAFLEWQLLRRYEKTMLKKFDVVTVVSSYDRQVIGSDAKIKILPIGVDRIDLRKKRQPYQLIFTGNLHYFPNRDAITWFAREVFPKIKNQIKDASLVIAGANPPPDVRALGRLKDVSVVPNPQDLKALIAQASLAVAPMRSGSGTQFKVIEALSVGTPAVISKTARNGLDFLSKNSLEISDSEARKFANKVVRILQDQRRMRSLSESGMREVTKYYLWPKIGKSLEKFLKEALIISKAGNYVG